MPLTRADFSWLLEILEGSIAFLHISLVQPSSTPSASLYIIEETRDRTSRKLGQSSDSVITNLLFIPLSLSLSPFFFSISLRLLFLRIFVFSFADSLHEFVDVFAFIGISRTGIRKSMRFGWSILDWQWEREREKGVEREVGWTGITCDLFERNYRILMKQGRGREEGGGFVWITVRTLKVGGHQIAVIFLPFRFFRAKTIRGNLDTLLRLFQFLGGLL